MKIIEKIIGSFTVVAILIYLFTVSEFGASLVLFSMFSLAFFYMVYGLVKFKDISIQDLLKGNTPRSSPGNRMISKFAGISIAIVIVGILFNFLQWEGGSFQLMVGLIFLSVVTCIVLIIYLRNNSVYYLNVLKRGAIFLTIGSIVYLIPSDTLIEFKYRNHPDYLEAVKDLQTDPRNEELRARLSEEQEKL